jgi:RimJ/RimL family protein N-acetyltransferase
MSELEVLILDSQKLRSARQFKAAFELIEKNAPYHALSKDYVWAHQPILWSDISAGICCLSRRKREDSEFLIKLWQNKQFIYDFHRHAQDWSKDIDLLRETLEREYTSVLTEVNQLHWVVRDRRGTPHGLLSLTNISLVNKSAEVLLGVLPNAPMGLSTASMLILFQFFFKALGFHKLYSFVYEDNPHSLKGTLHLGFKQEGLLREHISDPKTGRFVNLIQTGLLSREVDSLTNTRLMERLLK